MSNIIYPMIIFVFALGATIGYINETGMYAYSIPESGIESTLQSANETNQALIESTSDTYEASLLEQLKILGSSVFAGIVAVLTLGPLLISLGIPVGMAGMLISPLGIALIFWLVEMWLGRPAE